MLFGYSTSRIWGYRSPAMGDKIYLEQVQMSPEISDVTLEDMRYELNLTILDYETGDPIEGVTLTLQEV